MAENKTPEFEPPQACVQRVIKAVLPDNVQIGKDAKAAFSRSAGIFIMYLTACANDFCREAKRQTISAQDVMQAIKELEFGELEEPLREYLDQYRREASAKKQSKAMGAGPTGPVAKKEEAGDMDEPDADGDGDGETDGGGMNEDGDGGDREGGGGEDAAHQQQQQPNAARAPSPVVAPSADAKAAEPHPMPPQPPASEGPTPMDEDDGGAGAVVGGGVAMPVAQAALGGTGESGVVG
eukprot:jgi/Undpi1/11154/HiC_scaffold_30.g13452.m1